MTVTGVNNTFEITLGTSGEIMDFLNGFKVEGLTFDCRLGQSFDPSLESATVSMRTDGAIAAFKAVILNALNTATDVCGNIIDEYLANQLKTAFEATFGTYLPSYNPGSVALTGLADNSGTQDADTLVNANGGSASSAGTQAKTITVGSTSVIGGYAVDVLTDTSGAADDLWTAHNSASSGKRLVLLRQLPRANFVAYLPVDPSGAAEVLSTDALPLVKGNTLMFIIDADVSTAGQDANNTAVPETVPLVTDSSIAGVSFDMNLGSRRIGLKIKVDDAAGENNGAKFTYLTGTSGTYSFGPNGGAGTNTAGSAGDA